MNPPAARPPRRARPSPVAAVAALFVVLAAGACSRSEPTPAEARRDRVETRLRTSFSDAQTRCILDRAQPDLLRALDRAADLDPKSGDLDEWSDVVVACVSDDGAEAGVTSTTR